MFYSHESEHHRLTKSRAQLTTVLIVLTSPEHGVATIWLVATLGSRSITRRFNRKAILDVDVPKACNVISDPQAPMALRLQGNLLYGVSRVYNQQCGYTLTDVQSMHDRMKIMLPSMPGAGLDPMAGKVRPDQLILPYDPSFIPEQDLPGLGLDLTRLTLDISSNMDTDIEPSPMWPATPDLSQSLLSRTTDSPASLQLSFGSSDVVMQDVGDMVNFETALSSALQSFDIRGIGASALPDGEEGVLLQPDFEFDEDGNIIELDRRQGQHEGLSDELMQGMPDEVNVNDFEMDVDVQQTPITATTTRQRDHTPYPTPTPLSRLNLEIPTTEQTVPMHQTQTQHRKRTNPKPKPMLSIFDEQTELRNSELAHINSHYVENMALASAQIERDRAPAQAKKNAAFWVFGKGIGSVGDHVGVGNGNQKHPLGGFSGEELFELVDLDGVGKRGRKRGRPRGKKEEEKEEKEGEEEDSGSESEGRRVRVREEVEDHVGRGNDEEVELARHASSALRDDTSQMPWNITASIQSSRHGSSTANNTILRGMGLNIGIGSVSVSDFSSRDILESTTLGRARNRLTSASPLAGRGFPYNIDNLAIPGAENENEDVDVLGDFDLRQYLQEELYTDEQPNSQPADSKTESETLAQKLDSSTLDQDSQNFLRFLVENANVPSGEDSEDPFVNASAIQRAARAGETAFSELLPLEKTSRTVATHGLMHILTLATKGFLAVRQEAYKDVSSGLGARYEYGEIFVRLSGV